MRAIIAMLFSCLLVWTQTTAGFVHDDATHTELTTTNPSCCGCRCGSDQCCATVPTPRGAEPRPPSPVLRCVSTPEVKNLSTPNRSPLQLPRLATLQFAGNRSASFRPNFGQLLPAYQRSCVLLI